LALICEMDAPGTDSMEPSLCCVDFNHVMDCCVDCRLTFGEIVNIYGDEDCCCVVVGIAVEIVGIAGMEVVVVSNAVESNGLKGGTERCCPFESRLWKSI
jgi:hypothetical protein